VRVFLDTNVLVSAFATRGLCADLLELVLIEHDLVTGRNVLAELEKALRAKVKLPAARCQEVVDFVSAQSATLVDGALPADCRADEDDRRVLGEALAGEATTFVTGDAVLLALGGLGEMRIVNPRQLWELLRER